MIKRPGKVIKIVSLVFLIIEVIGFGIAGICLIFQDPLLALCCSGGILAAFLVFIFPYGFGQLVENSDIIVDQLKVINTSTTIDSNNTKDELPDL